MTSPINLARAEAEKLLSRSPAYLDTKLRESIAQALAALMVERDVAIIDGEGHKVDAEFWKHNFDEATAARDAEWDKAIEAAVEQCAKMDNCSASYIVEHISALRRPDAPANTEMPGEGTCPACGYPPSIAKGVESCFASGQGGKPEYCPATPTIEQLRAKVVAAAVEIWQDNRVEIEWLAPLLSAVENYQAAK